MSSLLTALSRFCLSASEVIAIGVKLREQGHPRGGPVEYQPSSYHLLAGWKLSGGAGHAADHIYLSRRSGKCVNLEGADLSKCFAGLKVFC